MVSFRPNLAGVIGLLGIALVGLSVSRASENHDELLDRWFAAQSKMKTWSADLVQIRRLKALKEPLKTPGRVWFANPNRFRWELGTPAQTIAVREATSLMVVYPRLKRAEQYPLDDDSTGQWRDALTLLESGFPQSRAEMEKQFHIGSVELTGTVAVLSMEPRSANTKKLLKEVRIGFDTEDMMLHSTELLFADDSSLKNEFTNGRSNVELEPSLFEAAIPDNFKVTQPLSALSK
jgi:outer membrane lipoprotein carrier protein